MAGGMNGASAGPRPVGGVLFGPLQRITGERAGPGRRADIVRADAVGPAFGLTLLVQLV